MSLSSDFVEFIRYLRSRRVEYLLVGGHALAFHGLPRFTKDIDFWVRPDADNAERLMLALTDFGFGQLGLKASDFTATGKVVQLGQPPSRIDLVTSIDGIEFQDAFERKIICEYQGGELTVISREDLIANKKAAGREQDLLDVKMLTGKS